MQKRLSAASLATCVFLAACSAEKNGDVTTFNGTGLVYRGGRTQVIDATRHRTYGFVSSRALTRWTSDDQMFRGKAQRCQILVVDARGHGTVVRAGNPHTLVRADDLSFGLLSVADTDRRVSDIGIEALKDSQVCASGS